MIEIDVKTLTKTEKQGLTYPERNRQYHSYGIRYWAGEKWMYWGSKFSKEDGHVEQWLDQDYHCWTTTDVLSAMFKAQGLSLQNEVVIEVVHFEEPKLVWVAWHKHRLLDMESVEAQKIRLKKS